MGGVVARAALVMALIATVWTPSAVQGQGRDPRLEWRTVRTEHFEIHYHEPLGVVARRVAAVAERAHETLAPLLRHWPDERTQIVLSDNTDGANGSATATPYNTIRLFATAPEDLTPLGDYDDWLTELVTHEHTHILHLDTIGGIPAVINGILGKVYPPNSVQPRWFVEGLAVYEESEHTSGGRLRSSMFDMYIRMDALEGRLLRLDQISNSVDRWPRGNIWYLYGSQFVEFIAERYGHEALTAISHDYGRQAIPYGLNRVARRATGKSFVALYEEFVEHIRARYAAVEGRVRERGLRTGRRLTFTGEDARSPRFLDEDTVVFWNANGRDRSALHALDARTGENQRELHRTLGTVYLSPTPGGRHVYFSNLDAHEDIYFFYDLFRYDLETEELTRLTHGRRAEAPDVSPDGRWLAYTVNGAATTHLAIAETQNVDDTQRIVVRNERFEQVYTPRWSPDGHTIAYSSWKDGGYRDIHLVDVATGRVTQVTHDRALDTGPAWSPDGRTLYFSSDRTGISNIYAYDLSSGTTRQVTNVLGGAFSPAVSPSGRRMVYLGYHALGYDLYSMALDPDRYLEAAPYGDDRPPPSDTETLMVAQSEPYDPVPTLAPHAFQVELGEDGFGPALAFSIEGGDVVGYHSYAAEAGIGLEEGNVNGGLTWRYEHSWVPVRFSLFRRISPRGGLRVEGERRRWVEQALGFDVGISYGLPRAFYGESLSLSYQLTDLSKAEPFGGQLDPNDPPPEFPETGLLARVRAGWRWSNTTSTAWDISTSGGHSLSLNLSVAHPYLGSQFETVSLSWAAEKFLENPYVEYHVLAMRYAGGISGGDLDRRGVFSVGGFPEVSLLDSIVDEIVLGGQALRGYPAFDRSGTQFHLIQAEYRFPIYRFMRGMGTLPAYARRIWAAAFVDYGDAFFGQFDLDTFRIGVGGQLMFDFTLGYILNYSLRLGVAQGLSEGGGTHFYAHLGSSF